MDNQTYQDIREEFRSALPGLILGLPDRTDFMIPLHRGIDWRDEDRAPGPAEIKAAVLEIYGVTTAELYANTRHDPVAVEARQMCAYIMVIKCNLTRSAVAKSMRRDRSTILHSIRSIEGKLDQPEIVRRIQRVLRMLGMMEG